MSCTDVLSSDEISRFKGVFRLSKYLPPPVLACTAWKCPDGVSVPSGLFKGLVREQSLGYPLIDSESIISPYARELSGP